MASNHICPECQLIFDAEPPVNGALICPLCNSAFAVRPPAAPALQAAPQPAASGSQVLRGVATVGVVLFLAGGIGYAYYLLDGIGRKAATQPPPATSEPTESEPPQPIEIIPIVPAPPKLHEMFRKVTSLIQRVERPPIAALPKEERRPVTLAERVQLAVDRGVPHLLARHAKHNEYRNYLGLLGLTLLECGTASDHAAIQQIAAQIRSRERELTQTYELTLAILFLDRLGEPRDRALIRSFGQRLLAGQLECGAWTYSCLTNDRKRPGAKRPDGMPIIAPLSNWPNTPAIRGLGGRHRIAYRGDNSNTQFAILGLWVAQRHEVPARSALLAAEQYFRATQATDGSWAYHPNVQLYRDSMTCAGLMSLAMRHGVVGGQGRDIRPRAAIQVHDPAIDRGLRYLAQALDKIKIVGGHITGVEARDPLYFLWSLERLAVIYDLNQIGPREWYSWAAEMLVQTQRPDGRWDGGDPVGTCFALLILRRSNFAKDLQLAVKEPRPDALGGQIGSSKPSPSPGPSFTRPPRSGASANR